MCSSHRVVDGSSLADFTPLPSGQRLAGWKHEGRMAGMLVGNYITMCRAGRLTGHVV